MYSKNYFSYQVTFTVIFIVCHCKLFPFASLDYLQNRKNDVKLIKLFCGKWCQIRFNSFKNYDKHSEHFQH